MTTKPTPARNPARYSRDIITAIGNQLNTHCPTPTPLVVDPMGGNGGIHALAEHTPGLFKPTTVALDIEPDYIAQARIDWPGHLNAVADATDAQWMQRAIGNLPCITCNGTGSTDGGGTVCPHCGTRGTIGRHHVKPDAIVVSPAYGNRMADLYNGRDGSRRNTYTTSLGHPPAPNSSAGLQWGPDYRHLHTKAWAACTDLLTPGGIFILNTKDHIRKGTAVPVTAWHWHTLGALDLTYLDHVEIPTRGLADGANHQTRTGVEYVATFTR